MWRLISETFDKILKNKYVDNFIIILILLNLTVFILQTEPAINIKYSTIIGQIELFTVIVFTIEYLMRLCTLKSLKEIFSPMMLVDLCAILPFYLSSITVNTMILRVLRLTRLLRLAKLARYSEAIQKIKKSFINKKYELIVTGCIFLCGLVVSSVLIYFAENGTGVETFKSIPRSFWWAIVTFTSVGYGDSYPLTTFGKFVAAFSAIMGVGLHGLFIGIIGSAFIEGIKNER